MPQFKCKICRRLGQSVCGRKTCAILKRPDVPGNKNIKHQKPLSDYGKELKEKQKLRYWYNLKEANLKKYVKKALTKPVKDKTIEDVLFEQLERRLDSVVLSLGFATTIRHARQLVSHKQFLVNGKPVNVPSYKVKINEEITIKDNKKKNFVGAKFLSKKFKPLNWVQVDKDKYTGKIIKFPTLQEKALPIDFALILEYYSK